MPSQRTATLYLCANCDAQSPKWTGQCLECGAWGSMGAATHRGSDAKKTSAASAPSPVDKFADIRSDARGRASSGIGEIDRVFGGPSTGSGHGGIVAGSVTLLGGEPGIGKSTLALTLAAALAKKGKRVLYVSGEESASQVKMRAERMGISFENLFFLGETDVDAVIATLKKEASEFAVIDSVHTLSAADIPSEAGAMNQLRGAVSRLVHFAKGADVPLLLIGHVTKDGHLAGPKTLEHLVDAVFSFEGERAHPLRVLRALKNRFGSTDETGIFEMRGDGLAEVKDPSAYLLDERQRGISGSVISCVMEGTRPVLVEIQALVQKTPFGYPTRRASGIDQSRLEMLVAVLGRRGGIDLGQHDVFVNVVGGLKLKEPAVDLAVLMALASGYRNAALPDGLAVWGEVGLGGEVRSVLSADRRLQEAAKLGLSSVLTSLPRSGKIRTPAGLKIANARSVKEALADIIRAK